MTSPNVVPITRAQYVSARFSGILTVLRAGSAYAFMVARGAEPAPMIGSLHGPNVAVPAIDDWRYSARTR